MPNLIDISDSAYAVLSRWASVSRTISEAIRLLEDYELATNDPMIIDEIQANVGELSELRPALDDANRAAKVVKYERSRPRKSPSKRLDRKPTDRRLKINRKQFPDTIG